MYLNKPSLLLLAAVLLTTSVAQAQDAARYEVQQTIKFPRNSSKISTGTQEHLREDMQSLATLLRYRPESSVEIAGFAEAGEKQPGILADARAQKVWEFLISLGLPAERMEPVGYGAPPGGASAAIVEVRITAEDALAMRQFVQPPTVAGAPEPQPLTVEPAPSAAPETSEPTTATVPGPLPEVSTPATATAPYSAPSTALSASEKRAQQREEARAKAAEAAAARQARTEGQAHLKTEQQATAKQAREEAAAKKAQERQEAAERRKAAQEAAQERAQAAAEQRKQQQAEAAERRKAAQEAALERAQAAAQERKERQAEAAAKKAQVREEAKQRAAQVAEEKKQAAIRAALAEPIPVPPAAIDGEAQSLKGKKIQDNQLSSSYTRPLAASAPKSALSGEGSYFIQGTAYFSANTATLTPGSAGMIESVARRLQRAMQSNPNLRVDVVGHADPMLESAQADALSQARAEALVKELADRGVDRARLNAAGAADRQPLTSKKDDPARGINMRAEIRMPN